MKVQLEHLESVAHYFDNLARSIEAGAEHAAETVASEVRALLHRPIEPTVAEVQAAAADKPAE